MRHMNIILVDPAELAADTVILDDRRAEHIRKILKSKVGDNLRAGIIDGPMGLARVLDLDGKRVTLRLDCRLSPPAKAATDLILALPRPIMLKRVLAQAAALGVQRIMLVNARRVEKSFFHSSLLAPAGLRAALLQGLEQAVDTILPTVSLHPRFRPFVEDEVARLTPLYGRRLLAHPGAGPNRATGVADTGTTTGPSPTGRRRQLLAIGPEGGWVDFEVDCFRAQGFSLFSPGPRILRVDTAVPVLLALAEHGLAPAEPDLARS
jgi:16S rRNA (uracil1498-N3)-methyltransferase